MTKCPVCKNEIAEINYKLTVKNDFGKYKLYYCNKCGLNFFILVKS